MGEVVTPFRIDVTDADLADLRDRLRRTRWPERETVDDWSQGIPRAYVQDLCRYWADGYDWRAREARLNGFSQYRTEIDGLAIHFVHVRSPHEGALPLVMTHGWPGSIVEFLKVIGPLTDPVAHGGDPPTPSTSSARRCRDTASAASRPRRAGASSGSRARGRR
jgi:epoxide hydrolase